MDFIGLKVIECIQGVHELSNIALKDPQAAFSIYINGNVHHWQFIAITTSRLPEAFKPLEKAIRTMFLPAL